jgi:hypothetical protein
MNFYEVTIKKGYNSDEVVKTVAAKNVKQAVDFAERFAKKNYYTNAEIRAIEFVCSVDIVYKS